jgi:hypothetical protein
MNRSVKILTTLAAGAVDVTDSAPIANGKTITVTKFGGGDINLGDNKSSAYLLQWGIVGSFIELGALAFTGNTNEIAIDEQLVGNGAKFIRITRQNNSASIKRCPVWVKGYDNT